MTARSKTERLRRLISHGFFAPELPPCFVSDGLARFRQSILREIDALPNTRRGDPGYYAYITEPATFHFPRFGREDRKHGVPNAVAHMLLSRALADNYIDLRRRSRRSSITLSPPVFDWSGARALMRSSVELRDDFRIDLSSRREEYVVGDIRAFFHSIYTHAIAWAIHGKDFAKRNRGYNHYGNLIDLLCRNAQDGQTIGLPVGPDTSRLIAEVVASAIDEQMQRYLGVGERDASRYIDDYTISSSTTLTGEALLAGLRQAASRFELDLNNEKSATFQTSHRLQKGWQQAVRSIVPAAIRGAQVSADSLHQFLYQLERLCVDQPGVNVEKFGLQNARSALVNSTDWQSIQSRLIHAYRRNTSVISLLVEACLLRQVTWNDVNTESLTEFVENRMPVLARANRTGEIIWFLFLAIRLRLQLSARKIEPVFSVENSFVALLASFHLSRGGFRGQVDLSTWSNVFDSNGLRGPMWLYAYEAVTRGLVPGQSVEFIRNDPYFSPLLRRGVQFLDIDRGYSSVANTLRGLRGQNERLQRLREAITESAGELDELEDYEDGDDEVYGFADIY